MIEIYSKTICPYCALAKQYLTDRKISFKDFVLDDDAARTNLYDELGLVGSERTVPQIFVVNGTGERERIGGYRELLQSDVASPVVFDEEF